MEPHYVTPVKGLQGKLITFCVNYYLLRECRSGAQDSQASYFIFRTQAFALIVLERPTPAILFKPRCSESQNVVCVYAHIESTEVRTTVF